MRHCQWCKGEILRQHSTQNLRLPVDRGTVYYHTGCWKKYNKTMDTILDLIG